MSKENESSSASAATVESEGSATNWADLSPEHAGSDDGEDEGTAASANAADTSEDGETSDQEPSGAGETPADEESESSDEATDDETATDEESGAPGDASDEAQPAPEVLTPEQLAARQAEYDKWLAAQRTKLEEVYKLSEEDAERVQTEPELVLPKLLAEMHLNVQRSVFEGLQNVVPQVMQQAHIGEQREKAAKDVFYKEWPQLAKHHAEVVRIGKMYREMNPKATPEKAIKEIGLLVSQQLGLSATKGEQQTQKTAKAPHRPAGAGSMRKAPAAPQKSEWADLIDD